MTQQDFVKAWAEEAKAAVGAKKLGTLLDLWKVVAEKKVAICSNCMTHNQK